MRFWRRRRFTLVLLDIMMPGMDGLEMCRKIRETNNIPIIMLSARSADRIRFWDWEPARMIT